jgi:hypothetical protein
LTIFTFDYSTKLVNAVQPKFSKTKSNRYFAFAPQLTEIQSFINWRPSWDPSVKKTRKVGRMVTLLDLFQGSNGESTEQTNKTKEE